MMRLTIANSEVALVIGGFGASDSVQVITKDATCLGLSSNPVIPKAPDGRVGWVGQVSTSCPASIKLFFLQNNNMNFCIVFRNILRSLKIFTF